MRDIADAAGINSTLVARYFKSKRDLFATVVKEAFVCSAFIGGERATYGASLTRRVAGSDDGRADPLHLLRCSANQAAVSDILRDAVDAEFIAPLALRIGGGLPVQCASAILSLLMGGTLLRLLHGDRPADMADCGTLTVQLGEMIQELVGATRA